MVINRRSRTEQPASTSSRFRRPWTTRAMTIAIAIAIAIARAITNYWLLELIPIIIIIIIVVVLRKLIVVNNSKQIITLELLLLNKEPTLL